MIDASDRRRAGELARKAKLLREAGRIPEAAEMYGASIAADPTWFYPWGGIAVIELKLTEANLIDPSRETHARRAHEHARRAVELASDNAWASRLLARTLAVVGDHAASIAEARRSVRLAPEEAESYMALSYVHKEAGHPAEALAAALEAVRIEPLNAECHKAAGRAHLHLRHWPEAEAAYRAALGLRADDPGALNDLYITVKNQGRLEEAIGILEMAARVDPALPHIRLNVLINGRSQGREHLSAASKSISEEFDRARGREPGQRRGRDWIERARPHIRSDPGLAQSIVDELRATRPPGDLTVLQADALLAVGRGDEQRARDLIESLLKGAPFLRDTLLRDVDLGPLLAFAQIEVSAEAGGSAS